MKKNIIFFFIFLICVATLAYVLSKTQMFHQQEVNVSPLNGGGIFVGDTSGSPSMKEPYDHQKVIRAVDEAWDNIRLGNSYDDAGQYQKAAEAYKKAYTIGGLSRGVSGLKLAAMYEKLTRFDDSLAILNELDKELFQGKSDEANKIRARLLVAK